FSLSCDLHFILFKSFFFSSRRRHTRFSRDWSSDVCSSDLEDEPRVDIEPVDERIEPATDEGIVDGADGDQGLSREVARDAELARSEERRVGKECISSW